MKKKSNAFGYILLVLFTACLAGGIIGLMANKMGTKSSNAPSDTSTEDYKINYKYYIDDVEVLTPVNQEIVEITNEEFEGVVENKELYSFDKYSCTNNVEGTWDNETWEFTPNLTASANCRLYFIKNFHDVTVSAVNGVLADEVRQVKVTVEKDKSSLVDVSPIEGYKFSDVSCTHDAEATYDKETEKLTIIKAPKDANCTVSFGINEYKAEIKVSNGTIIGEDTKSGNYGDRITFKTEPAANYGNPTVNCTNEQEAKIIEDEIVIEGLTNDTVCTVQYGILRHTVNINVKNGDFILGSTSTQQVMNGRNASFNISAKSPQYQQSGAEIKCDKNVQTSMAGEAFIIYEVESDLNCEITFIETQSE